jgi:hypothetical protein
LKSVLEFVSAASNRFGMHAGDFRDALKAAVPQPHGFTSGGPATLLFVQSAEQKIELPMVLAIGVFSDAAIWATALVNLSFLRRRHRPLPPWSDR